jgi:hypothetical protein
MAEAKKNAVAGLVRLTAQIIIGRFGPRVLKSPWEKGDSG